jgi:hypothetical protein
MKRKLGLRRVVLASAVLALFGGPAASSGCGAGFAPPSQIDGLRVLAVVADKPYAMPRDTVNFTMTYDDGTVSANGPDAGARPINIVWMAGCVDPVGDEYFGCYAQLAPVFEAVAKHEPPPPGFAFGFGTTFSIQLPEDIISRLPPPPHGSPQYGIAFVFFAACAGSIRPLATPDMGGLAGSFPLECVDAEGNRLGADSFVPGYTQIYAFSPYRPNQNPVVTGFTVNGSDMDAGVTDAGVTDADTVPTCSVPEDDRNTPGGCGHTDPFKTCTNYRISVVVPNNVAERDPGTEDQNGNELLEVVWVDYFADRGDVQDPILLVSDATLGIQADYSTTWIAPPTPGIAKLWAVVHDSRGGETVAMRRIVVQ